MQGSRTLLGAAVLAALALADGARAAPVPGIATARATLESGPAPGRGAVVVDPRAPQADAPKLEVVPRPGPMGPMTGPTPDFGGTGNGSAGAFHATSDVTIAGGTYDHRTYTVDVGVTVTYTGAATIRCTGDVLLQGRIVTTSDDAPIVLRCAGDVLLVSDGTAPGTGVTTTGARSGVSIDAAGAFTTDLTDAFAGSEVRAADGDVRIRTGTAMGIGPFTVIASGRGGVLLQAWGGDFSAGECAEIRSNGGETRTEATGSVTFADGATAAADAGTLVLRAIGRSLVLENGSIASADGGDLLLEAAGDVVMRSFVDVSLAGQGDLSVVSHGGDVRLGERAPDPDVDTGPDNCNLTHSGTGSIRVDAHDDVAITAESSVAATEGDVTLTAGTDIRFAGNGRVTSDFSGAFLRARAAVETQMPLGGDEDPTPYVQAATVSIQSGAGGIDLPTAVVISDSGPCEILSSGTIRFGGALDAAGDIVVRTTGGGIDLTSASIGTDGSVAASGNVLVETFEAPIDASDATIVSGDARVVSGDVRILVHTGKAPRPVYVPPARPAPDVLDDAGAILVTSASVRRPRSGPARIRIRGFAEGGFEGVALTHPGTFEIGGLTVQATRSVAPGKRLRYAADGFVLEVLAPRRRDGRTEFRLTAAGDVGASLDEHLDGQLDVHFADAVITGRAAVRLDRGRFGLATKHGRLVAPRVFVLATKGRRHRDGTADLRIDACIANDADSLPSAPEGVSVSVGDSYAAILDGTGSRRTAPGRFTSRRPAAGVDDVRIDYARGTLRIGLSGVALGGPVDASTVDLALGLSHGPDRRDAVLRLARHGTSLVYEGRR